MERLLFLAFIIQLLVNCRGESYCPSYCDANGLYSAGFDCVDPKRYCCGNETTRFCCNNSQQDIQNKYPDKCMCPRTSCIYAQWQTTVSVSGAALFIILSIVCCCQWSRCRCSKASRSRRRHFRHHGAVHSHSSDDIPSVSSQVEATLPDFNPSTFAFHPPAYDTLTKDPPKYDDLPLTPTNFYEGLSNQSFSHDYTVPPPPPRQHGQAAHTVITVSSAGDTGSTSGTRLELDAPPPYEVSVMHSVLETGRTISEVS